MAIAIESHNGKRRFIVRFYDTDGKRKSIRLPSTCNQKAAEAIDSKVQALAAVRIANDTLTPSLREWLAEIGADLTDRLVRAGLIEAKATATLGAFVDAYIAGRTDAEANTVRNWQNTRRKLTDYFGEDRELRSISPGDADDWRQSLVDKSFSKATISKAVKHAKQFLKAAVRKRLADYNPFAELKAGGERNDERKAFVTQETIAEVISACPDAEWKAIVALARYGGLRVPSELLALEWRHIDWAGGRFTVTSRKTKGQGKAWGVVPLSAADRRTSWC